MQLLGVALMLLYENIKLALAAIKINKMRSFLTMLGIIIGISSVIAITSIGASAEGVVSKEFENIGSNAMYVYTNWQLSQDSFQYSDMFFPEDIDGLKARFPEDILYICPSAYASGEAGVGRVKGNLNIEGVAADYDKFTYINIIYGRMINQSDIIGKKERILIDENASLHFFNKHDSVGHEMTVEIGGEKRLLTVIGVYRKDPTLFDRLNADDSYETFVPYPLLQGNDNSSSAIFIYTNSEKNQTILGNEIVRYLARIKDKDPDQYLFESAELQMDMVNKVLSTLSIAIGAIAAISLLVGGIGIMNIMLVSVTERTREIGIRKSLGARTRDILTQFLIESMILACIGGIIGTGLGIAIAAIGMGLAGVGVVINPITIILAVGFSALVGIFFGLYPAKKAAKLNPIDALRYE